MLYAFLILDTYLTQWLSLFASSSSFLFHLQLLVIIVSTKLRLPISPKLQHFHVSFKLFHPFTSFSIFSNFCLVVLINTQMIVYHEKKILALTQMIFCEIISG